MKDPSNLNLFQKIKSGLNKALDVAIGLGKIAAGAAILTIAIAGAVIPPHTTLILAATAIPVLLAGKLILGADLSLTNIVKYPFKLISDGCKQVLGDKSTDVATSKNPDQVTPLKLYQRKPYNIPFQRKIISKTTASVGNTLTDVVTAGTLAVGNVSPSATPPPANSGTQPSI